MPSLASEVLLTHSFEELCDAARRVECDDALVAVFPEAFDPAACPRLTKHEREAITSGNRRVKAHTGRRTREIVGRSWLPAMNASDSPQGVDDILLPFEITELAIALHNLNGNEHEAARLDFGVDEFRSARAPGILHSDGWSEYSGLNIHVTAVGEGALRIARLNEKGRRMSRSMHFFDPDEHLYRPLMDDDFHTVEIHPGTIAVLSAFGNERRRRNPVLHQFSTTSEFRSSLSLNQAMPIHKRPPRSVGRALARLGVSIEQYEAAFRR